VVTALPHLILEPGGGALTLENGGLIDLLILVPFHFTFENGDGFLLLDNDSFFEQERGP
jgi:hypothetical protein